MKTMLMLFSLPVFVYAADQTKTNAPSTQVAPPAAAVATVAADDVWKAGRTSISAFGSYRIRDFEDVTDDRLGVGMALSYALSRTFTVEAETISEGYHDDPFGSTFKEAGGNLKMYFPLGKSGWAPYGLLGYSHGFGTGERSGAAPSTFSAAWHHDDPPPSEGRGSGNGGEREDENRMNAGVGLEFRNEHWAVFADGRWTHSFEHIGHALFRLGASYGF